MSDIKFCCPNCGSEWKHLAGMTFGEIMSLRSKFQHAQIKIEGAHLLQGHLEEEIKGLKEDLERLREENEKLRARSVLFPESVQKIIDDYPDVCAERDRMLEALLFYVDANNWKMNSPLDMNSGNFTGGPAHDALEGVTEPATHKGPDEHLNLRNAECSPSTVAVMEPASPWRDIESAPRDGTYIDLWVNGERIPDARWNDRQKRWEVWSLRDMEFVSIPGNPTHWMPLQEPPR